MQQASGSSRNFDLDRPAFHTPQTRRRKRPTAHLSRKANGTQAHAPIASASASSWGAADGSEDYVGHGSTGIDYEVYSSSSSTEDDEAAGDDTGYEDPSSGASFLVSGPQSSRDKQPREEQQEPPRKRRVLASEDVGRFANLTIDPRVPQTLLPTSIIEPTGSKSGSSSRSKLQISVARSSSGVQGSFGIAPSAIEEPDELSRSEDQSDIDMRARKGPRTLKVDDDRFFVTSLSDSSSDEEAEELATAERSQRARTAKALEGASNDEIAGLLASHDDRTQYLINGELVSRLQAVDWQRQISLGRAKTAAKPLFDLDYRQSEEQAKQDQALVVWRDPQHITTRFAAASGQTNAVPASLRPTTPPPVVFDDGDFAYVKRPPDEPSATADGDEVMDIDS